jgi:hypothetical protein
MRTQPGMHEARHTILRKLRSMLETIGSANDAEDHRYRDEAARMREDSIGAIRRLLAEHAFLAELFPTLQEELDTQHILGYGWAEVCDAVDGYLRD